MKNVAPAFHENSFNEAQSISYEKCIGIDNVEITPSYMEFKDGSEGLTMQKTLTLRNNGNKAAIVKIFSPNSMVWTFNYFF